MKSRAVLTPHPMAALSLQSHTGALQALQENRVLEEKFVIKEEFKENPAVVSTGIFSPVMRGKLEVVLKNVYLWLAFCKY